MMNIVDYDRILAFCGAKLISSTKDSFKSLESFGHQHLILQFSVPILMEYKTLSVYGPVAALGFCRDSSIRRFLPGTNLYVVIGTSRASRPEYSTATTEYP